MPEGPEIRRQADALARAIVGERATSVYFAFDHLAGYGARLRGRCVEDVSARGKALLTTFDDGTVVYTHNQLYGRWMIRQPGHRPSTNRQLRFAIDTPKKSALLYSASTIEVLVQEELAYHPFLSKLGPDILDDAVTPKDVRARLVERRFVNKKLATLYLDQAFLAGLGNYLRSEILFVAGVHPNLRPRDLDEAAMMRLARATLRIARRAYATGGITNLPSEAKKLKAQGQRRRAYRHFVFGRSGHPCRKCAERVARLEISGRRVYVCPSCQRSNPDSA